METIGNTVTHLFLFLFFKRQNNGTPTHKQNRKLKDAQQPIKNPTIHKERSLHA
ncbi:hypothetical protein F511_29826 [Dorcoceras hygrometricum]|uniref:Uncharacterized protein n=1 Tax=Dorcoceras hygrometricum TaxID=472368 RepID=A0A2Z7B3I2_9LAMI|nr:hypothetical protein F511_29826 [Dorcoceras hygrometricum]